MSLSLASPLKIRAYSAPRTQSQLAWFYLKNAMPILFSLPKQSLPFVLLATQHKPTVPAKKRISHFASWVLVCLGQMLLSPNALADNESPSTNINASDTGSTTLSAYLEGYYLHDFNQSNARSRPSFAYSHNAVETAKVNLGLVKLNHQADNTRLNLALGAGSYMRSNYAAEPQTLQHLLEANVGIKLGHNLWLDAGVMPSHIGFESAIGLDNWTLTRSMLADNSPYFETGVKLSYASDDGKWLASGLLLNGWQKINPKDGSTNPALGYQLSYKPNANTTLNSSAYLGEEQATDGKRTRYFHNFYGQFQLSDRWQAIIGLDTGAEQAAAHAKHHHVWFSPVALLQYRYSDRVSVTARAEYYQDANQVIVKSNGANGFKTWAYSANLDYKVSQHFTVRTELRGFDSQDAIFPDNNGYSSQSVMATTAAIWHY